MKPWTIHTRHIPRRGFHAITLFPVVLYRDGELSEAEMRHETVHLWQQAMLLVVGFYVLYLTFWVIGLLRYRDAQKAYRKIPFEQSAYQLERREGLTAWEMGWNWMKWKIGR